jgi:DNA mismatch repair protein MutS2
MNKKVLKTVEFNKIITMLTDYATSEKGKEYCRNLTPSTDLAEISLMQQQTADALSRIFKKGSLSFSGVWDVTPSMQHLEIGGTLNATELLHIAGLLRVAKGAKAYDKTERGETPSDSLSSLFASLEPLTPVAEEISHCILSEDTFADDASPGLRQVRRQMAATNERIRSQMTGMLNNSTTRSYLQDTIITMRSGRYCFPVKAEFKSSVPGMVHDQSATGSTIFIEPAAVVNLNNHLRELQLQEQEEIEKILADLSNLVAQHTEAILLDYSVLANLDFIFAKGLLAKDMNAVAPMFNDTGILRLRGARHPLLDKKSVVPIDLTLGDAFDLLIVTGPNTGGKTVSLKTCGLFALMGQAGLHIPAKDRSELCIFDEVFADIGDEQSIEQSLSTFSSHMTNIIRTLSYIDKHPRKHFLVLFDELCAGTDPAEGAALAISILTKLHNLGIRTMATTHYSELKVFALSTPGVENACCEFSVETLSPTYHLLIGVPGKSNAFAISGKLGLPEDIISYAKEQIDEESQSFEDVLIDLEQRRITMEKDAAQIARDKSEIAALKDSLAKQETRLAESKDKILQNANEEAAAILRKAKDIADETIRDFNKYAGSNPNISKMEEKRSRIGKELNKHQKQSSDMAKQPSVQHKTPTNLRIGDPVKVLSMNMKGTVYSLPNGKGDLQVQLGIMRSKVNIKDLVLLADEDKAAKASAGRKKSKGASGSYGTLGKAATISPEINLLGMTGDEAVAVLDKYLDDAYLSHLKSVRVVHGKGTGALRQAVHKYLRRQKIVDEFHLAEFGEGDAGVTIVSFK